MRPPVPYFGSKQGVSGWIVSLLPPHEHYVEPFCGSLSVLLAKAPSRMETVGDLDRALMTFWRMLRDRPDDLARVCALTPHSRAEYQQCADQPDTDDELETARRLWVMLTQSRSAAMRPSKTGWRRYVNPGESSAGMPRYLDGYVSRMAAVAERLHAVSLECRPALEMIASYGAHPSCLLYIDPPYLGSTRGWGRNYRHEMKSDSEHRELAEALWDCAATVVLSGYSSALYDELYEGWDRAECPAQTGNAVGNRARTEVLWCNRPLAGQGALWEAGAA